MSAQVETMFSTRMKPWHGIGTVVEECPNSGEAIRLAGLDWNVEQQDVYTGGGTLVPGYKANVRDYDQNILGVVSDRYQVVQNREAFAFTDGSSAGASAMRQRARCRAAGGRSCWQGSRSVLSLQGMRSRPTSSS